MLKAPNKEINLVVNEANFDRMVDSLPELRDGEVYFISLSARNKYLTPEQRQEYGLGRTEMFGRVLVREKLGFYRAMRELEGRLYARRTKNGLMVPPEALVVYLNLNPTCCVAAYNAFKAKMDNEASLAFQALQNGNRPNLASFTQADRMLMREMQKCSRKVLLDVDVDTKEMSVLEQILTTLEEKNVGFSVVETHGGFHVQVFRSDLKGINLNNLLQKLSAETGKEVAFNKNGMVPMPGTLQAGFEVKYH